MYFVSQVVLENPDIDTIDWSVVDDVTVSSSGISLGNEDEDVAKGKDALSVLDNPETRNIFVDDLLEVRF